MSVISVRKVIPATKERDILMTNGVEKKMLTKAGLLKKKHRNIIKQWESDLI
jgi:hypothetical protein